MKDVRLVTATLTQGRRARCYLTPAVEVNEYFARVVVAALEDDEGHGGPR
jgi:hypothetical protein